MRTKRPRIGAKENHTTQGFFRRWMRFLETNLVDRGMVSRKQLEIVVRNSGACSFARVNLFLDQILVVVTQHPQFEAVVGRALLNTTMHRLEKVGRKREQSVRKLVALGCFLYHCTVAQHQEKEAKRVAAMAKRKRQQEDKLFEDFMDAQHKGRLEKWDHKGEGASCH